MWYEIYVITCPGLVLVVRTDAVVDSDTSLLGNTPSGLLWLFLSTIYLLNNRTCICTTYIFWFW